MKRFLKRRWAIAAVVLAVALVGIGIAVPVLAQTGRPPTNVSTGVYLDQPTLVRLAAVLGVAPADISTQLQTGKTLGQIAAERNVQTTALVEAIIAPHADQIALRVKYGYLTEAEAQSLLQTLSEQANLFLQQNLSATAGYNGGFPGYCGFGPGNANGSAYGWGGMMGGFGGMGPGMMGGWGGYYNGQAATPGTNPSATPGGTGFQSQPWNGGGWGGMMGRFGGMMGRW